MTGTRNRATTTRAFLGAASRSSVNVTRYLERQAQPATTGSNHAAGGGCASTRGRFGSKHAHCGALEVHIVIAGLATSGSSNVPTRTKIRCGRTSASLNSGVPHSGQNRRCIRLPLFATLAKSWVLPVTANVAVRKQALTVPLPAPRYWQSRHQHVRVVIGASELSHRTEPHRHPPVIVIASPHRTIPMIANPMREHGRKLL
jgi:hypothetical protein